MRVQRVWSNDVRLAAYPDVASAGLALPELWRWLCAINAGLPELHSVHDPAGTDVLVRHQYVEQP